MLDAKGYHAESIGSVYNLFSNNLIGKYVASFSIPPKTVPYKAEFYEFVIKKGMFDEFIKDGNMIN
ncbi:MAG: hypothetical protein HGA83_09915 [Bacteroidales bacterium]|nr:hypothetical protein [Bacteroidales bacterium]